MKKLYLITMVLTGSMTYSHLKAVIYTKNADVIKAIDATYKDVIPTGNILDKWNNRYETKWNQMLADVATYVSTTSKTAKLKPSDTNIQQFETAQKEIRKISDELFFLVNPLKPKISSTDLSKKLKELEEGNKEKGEEKKLMGFKKLITQLKIDKLRDYPTTQDIKKTLHHIVLHLKKIAEKIKADYPKIQKTTKPATK